MAPSSQSPAPPPQCPRRVRSEEAHWSEQEAAVGDWWVQAKLQWTEGMW